MVVFVPVTSNWTHAIETNHVEEYFILEVGSHGMDVVELKQALKLLGYDIDIEEIEFELYEPTEEEILDIEIFDEATEEQVKLLQEFYELEVTGTVDKELFLFILEQADELYEDSDLLLSTGDITVNKDESEDLETSEIDEVEHTNDQETQELVTAEEEVAAASVTSMAVEDVLQLGDYDDRVVDLKINLEIMGFKVSDNPTTFYGPITAQRVTEFQAAYGLPETGVANQDTIDRLNELATGPLRIGMYRDDVVQLKKDLDALDFTVPGNTTRYFGPQTNTQVMAFQKAHGLTADGIVGQATLDKIEELLNKQVTIASLTEAEVIQLKVNLGILGYHVSSNPNGNYGPITTQRVREFQADHRLPATGVADRATVNLLNELATGPLRIGMYREDVIQLKIDLEKVGFQVSSTPTNYFGSMTESQLKAFQKAHGLKVDGIAGEATLNKLKDLTSDVLSAGMTDERVIQLKINLGILGFPVSSNPTGLYGPITTRQVSEFQATYGLPVTGMADAVTYQLLDELANGPMKLGLYRYDVVDLKLKLELAGFSVSSSLTNYFGPITETQVKAFQSAHGLQASGIADQQTLDKLHEVTSSYFLYLGVFDPKVIDLKRNLGIMGYGVSGSLTDFFGSITRQQVMEFQAANSLKVNGGVDQKMMDLLSEMANGPLREGMYREDVIDLKRQLAQLGYGVSTNPTNYFGPITKRQLTQFQADYGLPTTGIADQATLDKLEELTAKEIITHMQSSYTMSQSIDRQLALNPPPQTDRYRNAPAYIHSSLADIVERGAITGTSVNLRTSPRLGTSTNIATTVSQGTTFTILREVSGDTFNGSNRWYEISYNGQKLYVHTELASNTKVAQLTSNANVRDSASGSSHLFGTASRNAEFVLLRTVTGTTVSGSNVWYEIRYSTWRNARQSDFVNFLDPDRNDRFQHLVLSSSAGVSASQLNNLLSGKGALHGLGQAFIDGGKAHSVNEVYLIAHALLETGHGRSSLATGIDVGINSSGNLELVTDSNRSRLSSIRTTHNMFGINAIDSDPYRQGAFHAYRQGWFTPEAAVIGGARFIGQRYIHNQYNQNTLYKMRWNPANPGFPQYATDMEWATKQVPMIKNLYDQLENPTLHFDFIRYR